jgi:ribosomal protein L16 Arg81 hydroxylase
MNKINFVCKEISISDEEFGCTVTLSENEEDNNYENQKTVDEIMNSIGQYVMLQRTFGEGEFEEDYHYFETSNSEKSGDLDDFEIILTKNQFVLTTESERYEIQIHPDRQIFNELKKVLLKITELKGKLNIQ